MVKIPGTAEGLPAIRRCLADGLNINITLLFSVARYVDVANAYVEALEERVQRGAPVDRIASVASFFVSRVDTKVDKALDAIPNALAGAAEALRGEIAIANAKVAWEHYAELVATERFADLVAKGARPQRLLWASTSPKDPRYPDVYYAEALIGRDTVDTMTKETINAYLDHGRPESRLSSAVKHAHDQIAALGVLGIDLDVITRNLEDEGVKSFGDSFDKALRAIAEKRRRLQAA
jgi:transaldolase